MTDDDDDNDNPTWTKEDFARAQPAETLPPEVLVQFPNTLKRIGRPPSEAPKVPVKLRLDPDVLAAFKADGAGWQTRINAALRSSVSDRLQVKGGVTTTMKGAFVGRTKERPGGTLKGSGLISTAKEPRPGDGVLLDVRPKGSGAGPRTGRKAG